MKLIYIISPYRAPTAWDVEQNIRVAEEAAMEIATYGAIPICVQSMYRYFNGTITEEFWEQATMEILERCDAAYVAAAVSSKGCKKEIAFCLKTNKPLFYDGKHLERWLREVEK